MGNQSSHHSSSNSNSSSTHHHHHISTNSANQSNPTTPSVATANQQLPISHTTVDGGFLDPQSHLYASAPQEYSRPIVHRLILERKLAPFFLGLNDFEPDWPLASLLSALADADEQALANLKEALQAAINSAAEVEVVQLSNPSTTRKGKDAAHAAATAVLHRERLVELIKLREKRSATLQRNQREQEAKLYVRDAVECPICFLYYPPPLVHTRCCDQPICTECFVQIKRADPTTTHLESEPAACPFCMEPNFGSIYFRTPPSQVATKPELPTSQSINSIASGSALTDDAGDSGFSLNVPAPPEPKHRRKSFAHTEKQVVTTDQIHPDWEAKIEAIKATVARRANRRIVFRQVGDRLIPVGITSGRESDGSNATMSTTALPPGFAAQVAAALDPTNNGGREGRRATRRRNQEMAQYLESMGVNVGQDLEEMMVLEAMRLSLQEDEERQKKEKAEKGKAGVTEEAPVAETSAQGASSPTRVATRTIATGTIAPGTPRTTATLMSEAIDAPMGSSSRSNSPLPLSLPPATTSSLSPPPSSSTPQSRSRAHSPSPSPSPAPTSSSLSKAFSKSHHPQSSSLSTALASVASKAASVTHPESGLAIKGKGAALDGGASIKKGLIGAGMTGVAPSRGEYAGRSAPPRLPVFMNDDMISFGDLDEEAVPTAPPASTSALPPSSSPSIASPLRVSTMPAAASSTSLNSSSISGITVESSEDDNVSSSPSQDYQLLIDDDDETDEEERNEHAGKKVAVPA